MEIKTLLYVTDNNSPSFQDFDQLMVLCKLGLEEVIFLDAIGAGDWKEGFSDFGLRSRIVAGEGPILSRVLDAVHQEQPSVIAANLKQRSRRC